MRRYVGEAQHKRYDNQGRQLVIVTAREDIILPSLISLWRSNIEAWIILQMMLLGDSINNITGYKIDYNALRFYSDQVNKKISKTLFLKIARAIDMLRIHHFKKLTDKMGDSRGRK